MKNKVITKMIAVKRRISITDELKDFIFKNINYRRKVYNDFVEESRKYDNIKDFNPLSYKTKYFNEVEKPNNIYDEYCVGISEQVAKDIKFAKKSMKGNKLLYDSKLRFKKINYFKGSFKVHCKGYYHGENKIFCSRVRLFDDDTISFRIRKDQISMIKLKEPIFTNAMYLDKSYPYYINEENQYMFSNEDVKEISFLHELGNFYIVLFINVYYFINKDEISKRKCGIDLGIHNPITLYDGTKSVIFRMSEKQIKRISYLKRRIKRLQYVISNKEKNSRNYMKIQKKICISYRKITNLRTDWRRKISLFIAKNYHFICLDSYKQPDILTHNKYNLNKNIIKSVNENNRSHCQSLLLKSLKHNIKRFGGKMIDSPKYSTRKCSFCGFINEKLLLNQRNLHCLNCNKIIDRDINASINCYDYI